jgi:hypothetical protein
MRDVPRVVAAAKAMRNMRHATSQFLFGSYGSNKTDIAQTDLHANILHPPIVRQAPVPQRGACARAVFPHMSAGPAQ